MLEFVALLPSIIQVVGDEDLSRQVFRGSERSFPVFNSTIYSASNTKF